MPIKNAFLYRSTELISQKKPPLRFHERAVNFPHESKSPPTPLQKGGAYLGFLVDVCHRLPLKNQVFFSPPPFLKGGGGDLLFITPPNAHKKTAPAFPQGRFILSIKAY